MPVNRAGIRKASGFGGNEPKGVARWFARATIYVARYEKCRGAREERKADYAYFLKGYGASSFLLFLDPDLKGETLSRNKNW